MKRVECHKYRTPTQDNPDCAWSVGILNLTEAEADMIARLAAGIRSVAAMSPGKYTLGDLYPNLNERQREVLMRAESGRNGATPSMERDAELVALQERINSYSVPYEPRADDRPPFIPGTRIEPSPKGQEEKEPEPIRNRFSGLDI